MTTATLTNTEYMHDHAIVTYADDPNVRYVVMQDTDADDPSEWTSPDTELSVYATSYRSTTSYADGPITDAFRRFYDEHDADRALNMTRRYARIFHDWTTEQTELGIITYSARGHSQSDWWDILVVAPDGYGTAESHAEQWGQWARGDVWHVYPERLITSCACGECMEWSREPFDYDGCGGIYADDAESAADYYRANY